MTAPTPLASEIAVLGCRVSRLRLPSSSSIRAQRRERGVEEVRRCGKSTKRALEVD